MTAVTSDMSAPTREGVRSRVVAWFGRYGAATFLSWDALAALVTTGVALPFLLVEDSARTDGVTILLVIAGAGTALLAVVLAAMAMLTAFMTEEYLAALGDTRDATMPYATTSHVCGVTAGWSLLSALAYRALPDALEGVVLAVAVGLAVWTLIATSQIVSMTTEHARLRAQLIVARSRARAARTRD